MTLLDVAIAEALHVCVPPRQFTVAEWADQYRVLDQFTSAEFGKWRTDRTPYLRQPMEDFTDPSVEEIVLVASTQVGKTETILNMIGFVADQDPGPMMVVLPRDEDTKAWAEKRARRALENAPKLREHLTGKEDDLQGKQFVLDRMYLKFAGANSPADLVSDPCRYVFFDEVEKYPRLAGKDVSALRLGRKRTTTFWNRKIVEASTPLNEEGEIWQSLLDSLYHRFLVPCPFCNIYQALGFRRKNKKDVHAWSTARTAALIWPENATIGDFERNSIEPVVECAGCGADIAESYKLNMVAEGVWCPEGADVIDGRIVGKVEARRRHGYHIPALISPWVRWREIAVEFLEAKDQPDKLRSFVNNTLAEPWRDAAIERVESASLLTRREVYSAPVPRGVWFLTAGIDVQGNRIEYEVVGWGDGFESWSIEYDVLMGSPFESKVWKELDARLSQRWQWSNGDQARIERAFVDSSAFTQTVYQYVRPRQVRSIFAIKGEDGEGRAIATLSKTQKRAHGMHLWIIGTDTAKDLFFGSLRITEPGPGYCHFPMYGEDYFLMLTAERLTITRKDGYPVRGYEKIRERNEALDCRIYAAGAAYSYHPATLRRFREAAAERWRDVKTPEPVQVSEVQTQKEMAREVPEDLKDQAVRPGPVTVTGEKRQPFPSDFARRQTGFVKRWR